MMPLPPGCTVGYEIRFIVEGLTDEIGEWFTLIGGEAREIQHMDWRGRPKYERVVQYGRAKPSHKMQNGTDEYLIRFAGEDASTASMFLIKFIDQVKSHNMKEYDSYVR